MPSLHPGFEYDIFISYRQKDNKYDGWVTAFVTNLKKELEATFKEDISIYFDENPSDGLLETHNVGKSLEGKLKCLVFIPVISQTYCDPKSFAWEHELCQFNRLAKNDQFGLDIKLINGNVASRILPVRIHDLGPSDKDIFEKEIGPLRGIEFIFKAQGVNRPLASTDNPDKSLNHIYYRDQVNKVANAVKEIIVSLASVDDGKTSSSFSQGARNSGESARSNFNRLSSNAIKISKESIVRLLKFLAVASLIVLAALGWLRPYLGSTIEVSATYSFIPTEKPIFTVVGQIPNMSISPDGHAIVFAQHNGICVQYLNQAKTIVLKDTRLSSSPVFSPNGQSVAFVGEGSIKKYDLQTGIITELTTMDGPSLHWGSDNRIYLAKNLGSGGIWSVSDAGDSPIQVTQVKDKQGEVGHLWPQLLLAKSILVYTALGPSGGSEDSRIVAKRLDTGDEVILVEKAMFGKLLANGDLLYATNNGNVFVVPFNVDRLEVAGSPRVVLSEVQTSTWGGAAFLDVSETGTIVFAPRSQRPSLSLRIWSESGRIDDKSALLDSIITHQAGRGWGSLRVSPSGQAMLLTGRTFGQSDIWVLDLLSNDAERLTFDLAEDETAVWSPGGKFLAYSSAYTVNSRRLYTKEVSGGKPPILIRSWPGHIHLTSWSPDSLFIAAEEISASSRDIWVISIDGKDSIAVARSGANEIAARFSPNGKWLVYQSDESGIDEVYVVSFPSLAIKKQLSIGGGRNPKWAQDGKAIFFLQRGHLVRQWIDTRNEFIKGKLDVLLEFPLFEIIGPDFEVSPDGKLFYMTNNNLKNDKPLHLITNWFQELKTSSGEK